MTTEDVISERQQQIDDARQMLDWLEQHPAVPFRRFIHTNWFWSGAKDDFLTAARELGSFEKGEESGNLVLKKTFGTAEIQLSIPQAAVCKKVTVMKEVEAWECEPLLSIAEQTQIAEAAA